MTGADLDLIVIQDLDSMVAFAGFWNYLGMEFGRATLLAVAGAFGTRVGDSVVVTEHGFDYPTNFPRELTVL